MNTHFIITKKIANYDTYAQQIRPETTDEDSAVRVAKQEAKDHPGRAVSLYKLVATFTVDGLTEDWCE